MKNIEGVKGKKIYVGMSGGVDSSVSALLLKESGAIVTGVFIKVWEPEWFNCTSKEERLEAMRVATHLGIPFITLDLEKEYKTEVVDYMLDEYRKGRTPNPDVMCNKSVKFGGFLKFAIANGADYIATGHYARTKIEEEENVLDKKVFLLEGKDKNKDQSYFLWKLGQNELSKVIFPVGDLDKSEVREIAKKYNLPNAEKKDSQGLCFIGKVDMKDFLKHYIDKKVGDVLNEKGEVIGEHDGAHLFTLGERHGFTITKKSPNDPILYVISKDISKNTLIVSENLLEENIDSFNLEQVNWCTEEPDVNKKYEVRLRYRAIRNSCKIIRDTAGKYKIQVENPTGIPTKGQSAVVYDGEICIGGGIIS